MSTARTRRDPRGPTQVHPTAVVDRHARLGAGVVIGPYSVIVPNVTIGDGTTIGPHAYIAQDTEIGAECALCKGAVLGTDPQDVKYEGEATKLVVGERTVIREFATLHRGTRASGVTRVGKDCFLMAYAHVAHDCHLGDHVVVSNAVQMGGHVTIEDWAVVGGLVAIHQFCRIGAYAAIGGGFRVTKDVPPYTMAAGHPLRLYGLNTVGLRRRGFTPDARRALKRAYRTLFNSHLNLSQAVAELRGGPLTSEVEKLLAFIEASERGVVV